MRSIIIAAAATATLIAGAAQAAVIIDVTEEAGGVRFAYSGSIATLGLISNGLGKFSASHAIFSSGKRFDAIEADIFHNEFFTASSPVGDYSSAPAGFVFATTNSGDSIAMTADFVYLPRDYASGAPMSGDLFFAGATFASLVLNAGSYVWTLPADTTNTITMSVGAAVVPLPAAAPLLLGALGLIGFAARRKG
jgi:hypothetical protein